MNQRGNPADCRRSLRSLRGWSRAESEEVRAINGPCLDLPLFFKIFPRHLRVPLGGRETSLFKKTTKNQHQTSVQSTSRNKKNPLHSAAPAPEGAKLTNRSSAENQTRFAQTQIFYRLRNLFYLCTPLRQAAALQEIFLVAVILLSDKGEIATGRRPSQ